VKTIFPTMSPSSIAAKPLAASARGKMVWMAGRMSRSTQKRIRRSSSSRVPMVEPITASWRKKRRVSSAGGALPEVTPETTRVPPGVDALGEACARLEGLIGTELERPRALLLRAARDPYPRAGGARQYGERGGDPARSALDEDGHPGDHVAAGEQHPVGGEPRRGQAGGLCEGELGRLGHEVPARYRDALGERPLMALGEERALRVKGLVAPPGIVGDDGMDDDLVAFLVDAGGIAAEDHREAISAQPDAAQRPEVVMVQRRRPYAHRRPARGRLGFRSLADVQAAKGIVGVDIGGVDGEHR